MMRRTEYRRGIRLHDTFPERKKGVRYASQIAFTEGLSDASVRIPPTGGNQARMFHRTQGVEQIFSDV
jgi:hypothetical protein